MYAIRSYYDVGPHAVELRRAVCGLAKQDDTGVADPLEKGARVGGRDVGKGMDGLTRITSYNVCYTKLLRLTAVTYGPHPAGGTVEQPSKSVLGVGFEPTRGFPPTGF